MNLEDVMSGYYVGIEADMKTENSGLMIATAQDVGIFLRALNDGSIFNEGKQEIYSSIYEYEHGGLVRGYQSLAKYDEDMHTVVIQFINTTNFDGYNWNLSEIVINRIVKIHAQTQPFKRICIFIETNPMKNIFLLLSLFLTLSACTDCDDDTPVSESDIVGNWELVAVLSDPGDGSGTFQPATGKTLQFTAQGVVNCNISFCFGSLTQATTTGTYNVAATSIDVENCTGTYSFNGTFLEVSHFCIEPCGERYVRIN